MKTSPATLSFHLQDLTHASLISPWQDGRFIYYAAAYDRMNGVIAFLTRNCCGGDPSQCAPFTPLLKTRPKVRR